MDFNLIVESDNSKNDQIEKLVKRAFDFGYECVALNTIINPVNLTGKNISIPEPKYIDFNATSSRTFRIMNRLTAVIDDNIQAHHLMRSPVTRKYDILAIQPVGEKILQHVASSVDVDIICLDLSADLGFPLKRNHLSVGIQKGICFEISYSPCLRDTSIKRSVITNSLILVEVSKGKNIILSSGALRPLELRSPEDVSNIGILFGLKANYAVEAVKVTGQLVMSHASTRKNTGCGFVSMTGRLKIPKQQGWIVKMCKIPTTFPVESVSRNKRKLDDSDSDVSNKEIQKMCKLDNE